MACAGTVVLHGGPNGPVTLKEALCVPTMHMNLLSGGCSIHKGGSYYGNGLHLTARGPDDRVLGKALNPKGALLPQRIVSYMYLSVQLHS